jgi:hypothetical protein
MTQELETKYRQQPWIDGAAIDAEIAESNPCDECGGKCVYRAERDAESYRAFAVCTRCGHEVEF